MVGGVVKAAAASEGGLNNGDHPGSPAAGAGVADWAEGAKRCGSDAAANGNGNWGTAFQGLEYICGNGIP